jgi:hypothetical protein
MADTHEIEKTDQRSAWSEATGCWCVTPAPVPIRGKSIELSMNQKGAAMPNASQKKNRWPRPLGLLVVWAGRAVAFLLRGCWHTDLGWPIREGHHSYQVCLGCGIKRLFDENTFCGYGPYGYNMNELIARERAMRMRQWRKTA